MIVHKEDDFFLKTFVDFKKKKRSISNHFDTVNGGKSIVNISTRHVGLILTRFAKLGSLNGHSRQLVRTPTHRSAINSKIGRVSFRTHIQAILVDAHLFDAKQWK